VTNWSCVLARLGTRWDEAGRKGREGKGGRVQHAVTMKKKDFFEPLCRTQLDVCFETAQLPADGIGENSGRGGQKETRRGYSVMTNEYEN
jgi:hypothetical protein